MKKHGAFLAASGECLFSVWAPEKEKMEVVIEGGKKKYIPLEKDNRGYWKATVENIQPGTRYLFRIDGELERPDPASLSQPDGVHQASAVLDLAPIQDKEEAWKGIPLKDMVMYELHVGTFSEAGDFEGVISKLPYLAELGVNAIELLPLAQFPGDRNWGYDGVYPFAVQNSYGGAEGLSRLVSSAHRAGIAVVLDVVYNHLGPEGNYFNDYGPYFTDKYNTPWGKAINFDDAWCDGVREYYLQNVLTWLDTFGIDGLRLDAVHAIWDSSAYHFMKLVADKVREVEERTGRKKVLIAEFDLNNPRYISSPAEGGYGLDGQWIDEFHHALHSVVTGETDGYYEDFGKLEHLERSMRDSYVYTGQFSKHRKKDFGVKPENPFGQFVVFAQNHDQVGNRMLGDRLSALVSKDALKLAACAYIMSPHVPMLFMGEEYGEKNPFQYFVSHTDEELVKLVREGRKKEFSYFKWEGEVPDPFGEDTYNNSKLSWGFEKDAESASMLEYYKHLIKLRKTHAAFISDDRDSVIVQPVGGNEVLIFEKRNGTERIVVVLNFSKQQQEVSNPTSDSLTPLSDSTLENWSDASIKNLQHVQPGSTIKIAPESALIFSTAK